jgi:hypothetical protein
MTASEPVASTTSLAVYRVSPTSDEVDALAGQEGHLPGVGVVGDHVVPVGQRGLDVDPRGARRLERAVHRLAWPQQRFGRDAGVVRALAAGQGPLDHRYPQAAVGQFSGAVLAWRPRAKDYRVVVAAHVRAP